MFVFKISPKILYVSKLYSEIELVFIPIVSWLEDDTPHGILSQKCTLWEGDLGKLPQPWGVCSYLIPSFLTDTKHLLTLARGAFSVPFWRLCQKLSLSVFTLIKLCYTKALEWSSLAPGHEAKSSSLEIKNPALFTASYQVMKNISSATSKCSSSVRHGGSNSDSIDYYRNDLATQPQERMKSCHLWQHGWTWRLSYWEK